MLHLPVLALIVGRIAGIVMFLPVIGGTTVPVRIRALLVFGLTILIGPAVPLPAYLPDTLLSLGLAVGQELLLGVLMGLVVRAVFIGVETGATLIAQESGLAYGSIVDPMNGVEQTVLSVFYVQTASVVFLLIGGHRMVLGAALDTFRSLPLLAGGGPLAAGVDRVFDALLLGGELAIRVAAPVVAAMFLVNIVLGLLSRTVPQLNVTTIGFSLKGLVGFVLIALSLPAVFEGTIDAFDQALLWARNIP